MLSALLSGQAPAQLPARKCWPITCKDSEQVDMAAGSVTAACASPNACFLLPLPGGVHCNVTVSGGRSVVYPTRSAADSDHAEGPPTGALLGPSLTEHDLNTSWMARPGTQTFLIYVLFTCFISHPYS